MIAITAEIEAQLYGKKKFNSEVLEMALKDLMDVLEPVNEQLMLNAFLTSNNVQLADLMLTSVLFHCYNDELTKDKLEKIPNVVRMFKFVSHLRNFVDIFGEVAPCQKRKEPEPFVETKEEEVEEKKEEKPSEPSDEKKEQGEEQGKKKNKKKNK